MKTNLTLSRPRIQDHPTSLPLILTPSSYMVWTDSCTRISSFESVIPLRGVAGSAAAAVEMIWPPIFSPVAEREGEEQHDVCLGHQQLPLERELLRKKQLGTVDVERPQMRASISYARMKVASCFGFVNPAKLPQKQLARAVLNLNSKWNSRNATEQVLGLREPDQDEDRKKAEVVGQKRSKGPKKTYSPILAKWE